MVKKAEKDGFARRRSEPVSEGDVLFVSRSMRRILNDRSVSVM